MWSKHPKIADRLTVLTRSSTLTHDDEFDAPPAQRAGKAWLDAAPGELVALGANDRSSRRWFASWDPRSRKAALALLAVLALVVAWWWWSGQPEPVQSTDTATVSEGVDPELALEAVSGTLLVHVVGKVSRPGVVELPIGSRVQDAIEAAGGATKESALATVNLARTVVDGEQIAVGESAHGDSSSRISINSASIDRLQELPGVGPVIAERIVQWREKNGPFQSLDELMEVSGIGPSMIEQIRDLAGM